MSRPSLSSHLSDGATRNEASNPPAGLLHAFAISLADKVMSVETRIVLRTFILTDDIPLPGRIAWMNNNQTFYYFTGNGSQNFLWRQPLDNDSTPHLLANLGNEEIAHFALSPDNSTLAFIGGRWVLNAVLIGGRNRNAGCFREVRRPTCA